MSDKNSHIKLKEALYINKNKANLNKQVHRFNTF